MDYTGLIQANALEMEAGAGRKELECSDEMNPTPTVMGSGLVLGFSEQYASQSDKPNE